MPFRPLILVILPFCLCATTFASERRYNVEIVILENADTLAGESERWRPEVVVPEIEDAVALEAPVELAPMVRAERLADLPEGFENLPPEQRKLGGAIEKLRESGRYRVLRHLAWQQPALGEDEAPRIRVHNGEAMTVRVPIEDFEELYALEDEASRADGENESPDGDPHAADNGTAEAGATRQTTRILGADRTLGTRVQPLLRPVEIHPLDGTIRLVVSRYLHIHTDLYFTAPVEWMSLTDTAADGDGEEDGVGADDSAADAEEPDGVQSTGLDTTRIARGPEGRAMLSYPFVQRRRMRSGESHYLDHPVLGLLIRVDRAEETDDNGESGAD